MTIRKILFIVPRSLNPKQMYREYPLGVGFIGTVLQERGYEVSVFDQNAEGPDDTLLWDRISSFQPDVVGFSIITPNYPVARLQIAELKFRYPEAIIIAGGIHVNLFPNDVLSDGADVVVLGEGEYTVFRLLEALEAGSPLANIQGVAFVENGSIRTNAKDPRPLSIDDLPIIDRNLYRLELYSHHSMVASRGCPYDCSFCCNYTGTVLVKGVAVSGHERVIQEMAVLERGFGAKEIFFADDIFFLKKKSIITFCEEYTESGLSASWIGQLRADTMDSAVADAMASANCRRVYFGIESGSDEILSRANKRTTVEKMLSGVQYASNAGIRVKTGWIYGLPGSLAEQRKSIDLMLRMRPHEISIHQLIPFPGTAYYSRPQDFGIQIKNPKDFESFCYGGIGDNINFEYLSHPELIALFEETESILEREGYVSSDVATPDDEYIFSSPLHKKSMNVFRSKS
jgi:anaerobic magnesium-protoporphyrin IX monomethyl ester cyclase